MSLRRSPEPRTLYGLDPDTFTSPLLLIPVIFGPPRKVVRRTPDTVPDATTVSGSASVPQLCSPETSAILYLFEVEVPNLSPLKEFDLYNRCPVEVFPVTENLEVVLPAAILETSAHKSMDTFSSAPQMSFTSVRQLPLQVYPPLMLMILSCSLSELQATSFCITAAVV